MGGKVAGRWDLILPFLYRWVGCYYICRTEQLYEAVGIQSTTMQLIALQKFWVHLRAASYSSNVILFCYNVSECQSHRISTTIWRCTMAQTTQLTRQKLDRNLFTLTLLLIKAHLASQKQKRTLFGHLLPSTVCTNVPYFQGNNLHSKIFQHSFWCIDNAHPIPRMFIFYNLDLLYR
jgi:hypothetical protein